VPGAAEAPAGANVGLDPARLAELAASEASVQSRRHAPDLLSQAMQSLMRQGLPVTDAAATAGVLDRRAILEAAARHGARRETSSTAADTIDRAGAPALEGADTSARQLAPRLQVAPPVMGRDLAALAERIEMLIHRRAGTANLNLTLRELGEVEITVRMESRQAHVQIVAHDAAARDALESALPRLRALLEQSGLNLGDVAMDQGKHQSGAGGDRQQTARPAQRAGASAGEPGVDPGLSFPRAGGNDRLLDAFA
jgi:flagellar hook-length control protein FliK